MKSQSGTKRKAAPRRARRKGSALVMSLVVIVLITVITVGYLASVMLETKTARAGLDQRKAHSMAVMAFHAGMAKLRDGLGPWDNPLENFASNAPTFFWSLSPGRLTRWSYTDVAPASNVALFSEADTTNVVNLNRRMAEGSYPIIAGTNPPAVPVKWVNVLRDPAQSAGTNNPVVGRYAFWIDDEGAKINVNVADGTEKYSNTSLGVGTPAEVSLEVLSDGGAAVSKTAAKEVVSIARSNGFFSPREILRASGVTPDIYTNNVFYLTSTSRSPEINVFGQPRMALLPGLGNADQYGTDIATNGITLRSLTEIYPTPSQLPQVRFNDPISGSPASVSWPMVFRQEYALSQLGRTLDYIDGVWGLYSFNNYTYANGLILARYLSGTNSAGRAINWPVFSGSGSTGFRGKYSLRQIDSIAAQVCNLGSRAVSPDMPYAGPGSFGWLLSWYMQTSKDRFSAPVIYPGFVSGQWISGMGRSPKVTSLLMRIATFSAPAPNEPPTAEMDVWLEWWLPSAFRAASDDDSGKKMLMGHRDYSGLLNAADGVPSLENEPSLPNVPAILPKTSSGTRLAAGNGSYWGNQLLRNSEGIDFAGNPKSHNDPDQALAQMYHDPYARSDPANPAGPWLGEGAFSPASFNVTPFFSSPLRMGEVAVSSGTPQTWNPGEIRVVRNLHGSGYALSMRTNSTRLDIEGGIAVRAQMRDGLFSDPDPVPLEAVRGIRVQPNGTYSAGMWTFEQYGDSARTPGNPSETVRDRVVASVIPINVSLDSIPSERWVLARVRDPLVNKFPGDWEVQVASSAPTTTMQYGAATTTSFNSYSEDDAWRASLADRDSYWMPFIDSAYSAGQAPLIPRSARLPSLGYLQYVRTGIIPDDESVPYAQQHGTPFRLFSYAPSTEARSADPLTGQQTTLSGSQSYPDWAMLDLLYVPSTLRPYGSPYNNATNLIHYGTYGGATAGRINPNGAVIYTTNVDVPQPDVSRMVPLQAAFAGLKINPIVVGSGTNVTSGATWAGSPVDAERVAEAIESYIRTNGPLRMPGEICNVPYIASLRAPANKSRNDLVRQSVGNLTTQGNVFSVWTAGQVVAKKPSNSSYGEFEAGDNVLSEVRLHFIIERYLDPGADGAYGNKSNLGSDLVMGSYDDSVDPVNHPFQPRYLYRVISSEEIR